MSPSAVRAGLVVMMVVALAWAGTVGEPGQALAAGSVWRARANLPTARIGLAAATGSNGRVYAIGGVGGTSVDVHEYDPAANTWTARTPIPVPQGGARAAVGPDGRIFVLLYVPGGNPTLLYAYNPATNTWTSGLAPMPTTRTGTEMIALGGKILVVGGANASQQPLATVEEYDPVANSWRSRASLSSPRYGAALAVANGKLYAIGGGPTQVAGTTLVDEYDPTTNSWVSRAPMPTARLGAGAFTDLGGKIHVVGGQPGVGTQPIATEEIYDPVANVWATGVSMATARSAFGIATIADGRAFVIGGDRGTPGSTNLVEEAAQPVPTATSTVTSTATSTGTATLTVTATQTGTATETGTPTATPTITTTATSTRTATITPTNWPTATVAPASTQISTGGGTLRAGPGEGTFVITVPQGALHFPARLDFYPRPLPAPSADGTRPVAAFALFANQGATTWFDADVEITVRYDAGTLRGLDEQTLAVYINGTVRERLTTTVDPVNRVVRATTRHFTEFELSGSELPTPTPRPIGSPVPTARSGWARQFVPNALLRRAP